MLCHECLMNGKVRQAVGVCKFCYVGLCKEHLMALYSQPPTVPQYSCRHDPAGRPIRPLENAAAYERMLHKEFNVEADEAHLAEPAEPVGPRG
jgi:Uncharacterized protein conserved in archaea (DUF2180)